jgi:hypothetical protein
VQLLRRAMIIKRRAVFPLVRVEPPIGIEPMTYSLRGRVGAGGNLL